MAIPCYRAYGLTIQSDIPLLQPISEQTADIIVSTAPLSHLPLGLLPEGDGAVGELQGTGRFLIRRGQEIIVDPDPAADADILRPAILGSAMAVILQQRGYLALHASCVVKDGQAIAFIGVSGAGKSTTASAFAAAGYTLITDDVMAVKFDAEQPHVIPSFPLVKLLPDAITALGHKIADLAPLNQRSPKRVHQPDHSTLAESYPLQRIYLLGVGDEHQLQPVNAHQALLDLVNNTRAAKALATPALKAQHFQQCVQLVKAMRIQILQRRRSLQELSRIIDLVQADLSFPNAALQ